MAREATITLEQVATAADNIKAQGGKASARAVREVLGSGSMATVLKLLQQWQSGQVRQSADIDDTLDPSVVRAISNQITIRVQEATADTTARLGDLQAEADLIIVENERQAADLEVQAAELVALHQQYAELAGRAHQLESDATRTAAELVAERRATEAARVELAKAELRLEAIPKIEAEIDKVRAELLQTRAQAAELHEAAAVATVKLEGVVRELAAANEAVSQARTEARLFNETAAELRGQLSMAK
jgi:chromosome segregation ATPase